MAVLARRQAEAVSARLFATRNGTWVAPNNLRRSLRSALAGTDLTWVTYHSLRRTEATRIERELGADAAARQLGHSRTAVTLRHYVEQAHDAGDIRSVLQRGRQTAV